MKTPNTNIIGRYFEKEDKYYIQVDSVIAVLKDDLINILTNADEEALASEYIKERLATWKGFNEKAKKKANEDEDK